ncbi:MAG TPA: aminoglycoside phosphotransferase family protein [Acidimicrobiia bacterium]
MNAREIAATLAPNATIKEMGSGSNKVFRVRDEAGRSTVLTIYSTPARERRERHSLEALEGIEGVPQILERGATEGSSWIRVTDAGSWTLASLPKNLDTLRKAGAVLRAVHDSGAAITNLEGGIDGDYVQAHFRSTLDRLERYRRRLGLPADVLARAKGGGNTPAAGRPKPSHTRPYPRNFVVSDGGSVTLIDWEWATLAPPEWDLSLASWRFGREMGGDAAEALWEGYGAAFSPDRLNPWIAYHASMMMLDAAEKRDGRLGDLAYLVDDLAGAIA